MSGFPWELYNHSPSSSVSRPHPPPSREEHASENTAVTPIHPSDSPPPVLPLSPVNLPLTCSVAHEQSMLERSRVIFREVSRDQLVSNYYLLVLYMSGACSNTSNVEFWTRARANRGHRARSSIPRVLEKYRLIPRYLAPPLGAKQLVTTQLWDRLRLL